MNHPTPGKEGKKVLCAGKKVLCVENKVSRAFPRSFLNTKMREKISRGAEKVYAR